VWEVCGEGPSLRILHTYQVHNDAASALAVTSDDLVCAGGWDGTMWSINPLLGPQAAPAVRVDDFQGRVLALATGGEGKLLAAAGSDHCLRVYV
jgi:hypothetical protein